MEPDSEAIIKEQEGSSKSESLSSEGLLRYIEEIPHPYQQVFANYPGFNTIQSKVFGDIFYKDESVLVSAPTGSGKTAIFELAIVRLLLKMMDEPTQSPPPFKIIYVCPLKALCEERLVDWHRKFSCFGINAISVTGDSDNILFQDLCVHNLIITTPEKWDCLTRKWRGNEDLVQAVKLFMIDEIHTLNEDKRGATLEAIVCRMKTIESSAEGKHQIRFVAVSATIPNIEDVAEWIGTSVKCHSFTDECRPVKLNKIVIGYPESPKSTPFKFDMSLTYKLQSLIMQHSHGKPTLIFCATRKMVEMTVNHLLGTVTINLKPDQKIKLLEAQAIFDQKLRESVMHGVAYHHGGLLPQVRRVIENLFRNGDLPILVATSTLAMGVNLPAHLVIVKSTKRYADGGFVDLSQIDLQQMIGRAGRPQFDTEATALILTSAKDKEKFEKMLCGSQIIESDLHKHLSEHLNAEIGLKTIRNLGEAMRWLSATFFYVRARKNPRYYGLTSSDPVFIDRKLLELCQIEVNKLITAGMITMDQDLVLDSTPVGAAMAKYCLAFESMKLFTQINGGEVLQQILALVSKCSEFSEMYLRVNDKKCLNLLNKCRNGQTIRFPLVGKIKSVDMKINCIIQAVLGCLDICDHGIMTEALTIMRNGERIVNCLAEYLEGKDNCFQALLSTIILAKCFKAKLWENSPYLSKQLPGIGNVMSTRLMEAGKTSFEQLARCDPRQIEMIINKKPPVGLTILDYVSHLPQYKLTFEVSGKTSLKWTLSLLNASDLKSACTVDANALMHFLIGDSNNRILLHKKYSHAYFIENVEVSKVVDFDENVEYVKGHFVSDDFVGIDCFEKCELVTKPKEEEPPKVHKQKSKEIELLKVPNQKTKVDNKDSEYMKTFMETFMKSRLNEIKEQEKEGSGNGKIIIHENVPLITKKNNSVAEKNAVLSSFGESPSFDSTMSYSNDEGLEAAHNAVRSYKFTPRRRLSHRESKINVEKMNSEASKPVIDNEAKTPKITWKSPLTTFSPPVKFSPNISHRLSVSQTSSPSTSTSLNKTKLSFPLTDKDFADSMKKENINDTFEECGDIAVLEDFFGYDVPPKRHQNQTANKYFHQLLLQSNKSKNLKPETVVKPEQLELQAPNDTQNKNTASKCESSTEPKFERKKHQRETQNEKCFIPPKIARGREDFSRQQSDPFNDSFEDKLRVMESECSRSDCSLGEIVESEDPFAMGSDNLTLSPIRPSQPEIRPNPLDEEDIFQQNVSENASMVFPIRHLENPYHYGSVSSEPCFERAPSVYQESRMPHDETRSRFFTQPIESFHYRMSDRYEPPQIIPFQCSVPRYFDNEMYSCSHQDQENYQYMRRVIGMEEGPPRNYSNATPIRRANILADSTNFNPFGNNYNRRDRLFMNVENLQHRIEEAPSFPRSARNYYDATPMRRAENVNSFRRRDRVYMGVENYQRPYLTNEFCDNDLERRSHYDANNGPGRSYFYR